MSSPSSLRDLQVKLKSTKRSMRKYLPIIAKRTGDSIGTLVHYFDGHGTIPAKYQAIIIAVATIQEEIEANITTIEADKKTIKRSASSMPKRQYAKHQTF